MNIFNEIQQLITSEASFYGTVEQVVNGQVYISTGQGGRWFSSSSFSVGDRVFVRGDRVELSPTVSEGNVFQV